VVAQDLPDHLRQPGLLRIPEVQKELMLSPEDIERTGRLAQNASEKYRLSMEEVRGVEDSRRNDKQKECEKALNKEIADSLADLLTPKQLTRFRQIELRWRGPAALEDDEVHQRLKLSDEQRRTVARLAEDARRALSNAPGTAQPASTSAGGRMQIQQRYMDQVIDVLNDEQKAAWKILTGEPFAFKVAS
jgi:hypothetical protein